MKRQENGMLKNKYPTRYFPTDDALSESWLTFCDDVETLTGDLQSYGEFIVVPDGWEKIVWDWYINNYYGWEEVDYAG